MKAAALPKCFVLYKREGEKILFTLKKISTAVWCGVDLNLYEQGGATAHTHEQEDDVQAEVHSLTLKAYKIRVAGCIFIL